MCGMMMEMVVCVVLNHNKEEPGSFLMQNYTPYC